MIPVPSNTRAATVEREEAELTRLLDSLTQQRQLLQDRRAALSASIETRPEVERTLTEFERRLTQLRGQLDVIVAYPLTEKYIDALEWKGAEEYKTATRKVWRVDGDVAGYAREVRVNPN